TDGLAWNVLGSGAYITGSHAIKVGFNNLWVRRNNYAVPRVGSPQEVGSNYLAYRFNNGVPNQITECACPYTRLAKQPWDLGVYAQDTWTLKRMTVNAGVRFQYYDSYAPVTTEGPAPLVPTRNITFPETQLLSFKDLVPRLGATYDLFGNGKTAVKVSLNKYVQSLGSQVGFQNGALDPVSSLALYVTRSWNDANHNFTPDCNLSNPLSNGECGTVSDTNFGSTTLSNRSDPRTTTGWGERPYQWEFSTSVQQELTSRVSVNFGYFRRSFGNFIVTDNLAVAASDYSPFYVTAPLDPRLPGGGGYTIGPFYDRNPNTLTRPANNIIEPASDYGNQTQVWSGYDLTMSARPAPRFTLTGGMSTGRTLTDNCAILAQVPEASALGVPYCHQLTNFLTDLRMQSVYIVPKIDVQLGAVLRSSPGPAITANQVIADAAVRGSLGRDLSGGAANVTVNLVAPGTLYGDRVNELDLRIGKKLTFGRVRSVVGVDVYNALNANPALTEGTTYQNSSLTGWRVPTSIQPARFAKISLQLDF
ncbi:MAG TPA: hypothetical protein VLV86_24775, partial [Vicinamibacterales bacterium]|nr:hypothetical protein [Vicinamibacterales bacterium]